MGLDADLRAYYTAEAEQGLRQGSKPMRSGLRDRFVAQLLEEGRRSVVDVGAGPGIDAEPLRDAGFSVVGVDLVPANVVRMRERRLDAVAASLYALPFPDSVVDALWTMSTFVHVPHHRFDEAMGELLRVVRPGGLLAIGTWGGQDYEGHPQEGMLRPHRFFSLASHDRWRSMLERHADLEQFETFEPEASSGWEYQYAQLRRR
ncbi:MAG: class I SAM-dependent methyltransferase [Ilumatobacteraceae bacterium]